MSARVARIIAIIYSAHILCRCRIWCERHSISRGREKHIDSRYKYAINARLLPDTAASNAITNGIYASGRGPRIIYASALVCSRGSGRFARRVRYFASNGCCESSVGELRFLCSFDCTNIKPRSIANYEAILQISFESVPRNFRRGNVDPAVCV